MPSDEKLAALEQMAYEVDLHDFLRTIDAVYARPELVSKEEAVTMLWQAGRILGQMMVLSEMEMEAALDLERSEPEGNA
ncbi:MAG TPA: hypothetical protein VGN97_13380 [Mesorhizobium sp.]|jgi:hypothetical protein|nr:hypothetical protein [Mesorhizobium sp.]